MKFFIPIIFFIEVATALPKRAGVVPNTPENIEKIKHLKKGKNAWELSGQFQGDIVLSEKQLAAHKKKNGVWYEAAKWSDKTIPYVITGSFTKEEKDQIREALDQLENFSCLKIVPRTNEEDYVDVTNEKTGCWSYVGRYEGRQQLNLEDYCITYNGLNTIMHEFIHAIGFYHMQNSYNRDDYITIVWENVAPGSESAFDVELKSTDFGVEYDIRSLMHYSANAFSINGEPTMIPKDPDAKIRDGGLMSRRDIEKINRMYDCPL